MYPKKSKIKPTSSKTIFNQGITSEYSQDKAPPFTIHASCLVKWPYFG